MALSAFSCSEPNLEVENGLNSKYDGLYGLNNNGYSEEFKGTKFVIDAGGRSYTPHFEGLEETGFLDFVWDL